MVTCRNEKINYRCKIDNGSISIISDTTSDKGGLGNGFRPHELLEAALAACMNISIRMKAEKEHFKVSEVITKVHLDRSDPGKTHFLYSVDLLGDLKLKEKQMLLNNLNFCPVRKTLSQAIEFIFQDE